MDYLGAMLVQQCLQVVAACSTCADTSSTCERCGHLGGEVMFYVDPVRQTVKREHAHLCQRCRARLQDTYGGASVGDVGTVASGRGSRGGPRRGTRRSGRPSGRGRSHRGPGKGR
jgi:hypothetical protein